MRFLQVRAYLETLAKYDNHIYGVPLGSVQRFFGATPMYWLNKSRGLIFCLNSKRAKYANASPHKMQGENVDPPNNNAAFLVGRGDPKPI